MDIYLGHDGLDVFVVEQMAIHKSGRDAIGCTGCLNVRHLLEHRVRDVKVTVYHDRRTTSQINVLLPPVAHVVGRDEPLEDQVAL